MSESRVPINLFDFEDRARERLPRQVFDYIAGGATDEVSIGRNRRAFEAWALRPRVLGDVSDIDPSTTVLGTRVDLPVLVAPCGDHRKAHPDGELATYRAARRSGTIMAVSANASTRFDEIARAAPGLLWLQVYPFKDRRMTEDWLALARDLGYDAICVTLDSQYPPKRERDIRNGYVTPAGVNFPRRAEAATETTAAIVGGWSDPAATWDDLAWINSTTDLPVVAKGIMTGDDAAMCVEAGVRAVIVSNHGGRHLDNTLATIEVLPEVVAAADGRIEVLVDGGIRRGADVVKAIALGATAVLIGRPLFWGLAFDGEEGVVRVLEILRQELMIAMAKVGRPTIGTIGRDVVVSAPRL